MTQKVSQSFKKLFAKNHTAVENAKKAENQLSNCPLPIGFKGKATVTGFVLDEAKATGKSYCRMEYSIIDDAEHQGKKTSRVWSIGESEKRTFEQSLASWLDDMENQGLPREVREGLSDPTEISEWFMSEARVVALDVKEDTWAGSRDGKKVSTYKLPEAVGAGSSMSPDEVSSGSSSSSSSDKVMFLGKPWTVVSRDGEEITIKNENGKERIITADQLDNAS